MKQSNTQSPQANIPLNPFLDICGQWPQKGEKRVNPIWCQNELDAIEAVLRASQRNKADPIRLLEVGCGTGRVGVHLAQLSMVSHYTGVDVVESYVQHFREMAPNLDIRTQSIFSLSNTEETWDVSVAPFTTIHLFNFDLQEVVIRVMLHISRVACLDAFLPDWGRIHKRWVGTVCTPALGKTYDNTFYAMPKQEYEDLAKVLGVQVRFDEYRMRSRNGGDTKHVLITFSK